jgi:putative methionine-R-sulfoxide reductase with GAF domain
MNGNSTGIVLDLHQIIDLSEEGMAFQSSGPMEIGETLYFSVDLSEPKTYFHTMGRVVWSHGNGRTGVRFQKTTPEDAALLHEWLFTNDRGTPDERAPEAAEALRLMDPLPRTVPPPLPENKSRAQSRSNVSALLASEAVKQEVESLAIDLDSALQIVVQRAISLTRATGAAVAVFEGGEMVCRATSGPDAPPVGTRLHMGNGFSGACVRLGRLLHCDDSELDELVDRQSCRDLGIRSIMAAPIRSSDAVIGLVEIFSPDPGTFGDSDKAVLQNMAGIVVQAMDRAIQTMGTKTRAADDLANRKLNAYFESFHDAADELVQSMAAPTVQNGESLSSATPLAKKKRLIKWVLATVIGVIVLVIALLTLSGWLPGLKGAKPQSKFSEQSSNLNGQATLGGTKLEDLKGLADQGDPGAEFTLGLRYATGSDAPQDYGEAARWFSKAAERGHVLAQSTLVTYYWAGRGVPQDFKKAYYWGLLAQSAGDEASRSRVPFLAARLDHEDLITVQHRANDWIKQHHLPGKPSSQP